MASTEDVPVAAIATPAPDLAKRIIATIREAAAQREEAGTDVVALLRAAWPLLPPDVRIDGLRVLPGPKADAFFVALSAIERAALLAHMPAGERGRWMRLLAPDDAVDVLQRAAEPDRAALLEHLDTQTRTDVTALLAYAEDEVGGLMHTRFARLRPQMT